MAQVRSLFPTGPQAQAQVRDFLARVFRCSSRPLGGVAHRLCIVVGHIIPLAPQNNALVSFRAGLMTDKPVAGTPKVRVTADPRKGEARLVRVRGEYLCQASAQ